VLDNDYEWDSDKDAANQATHGVAFAEAVTVFADERAYYADDGSGGGRLLAIGFSAHARLLTVVHVERGKRTRIISAWRASTEEERRYAND
jgi:hypothetical protein